MKASTMARVLKNNADLMDRAGNVASGYGEHGVANACWSLCATLKDRARAERARVREELPVKWADEKHATDAIRARLAERGITQAAMAADIGISEKHLSQVLTGKAGASFKLLNELLAYVDLALTVDEF